jgi:hypothetical protein
MVETIPENLKNRGEKRSRFAACTRGLFAPYSGARPLRGKAARKHSGDKFFPQPEGFTFLPVRCFEFRVP